MSFFKNLFAGGVKSPAAPKVPDYAFVSYSRSDASAVQMFADYLVREEIPPWVDNQIQYGESWERVIIHRIRNCKVFMVVMSPNSRQSGFVKREVDLALKEEKLIIPILISGDPFEELRDFQYVNLKDFSYTYIGFVERLRDILTPAQIPSIHLQRRRVEYFLLHLFEVMFGVQPKARVFLGFGYDITFGVELNQSLVGEFDELDWSEIFMELSRQFPRQHFGFQLGVDYGHQFPTIKNLVGHLMGRLSWEEIRKINLKYKAGDIGLGQ